MTPTMQGLTAGGEARAEASVGAAKTGAAQRGGDGSTAALRSGDGASQEAAETARGQKHILKTAKIHFTNKLQHNTTKLL